jgi:endonuclease I
MVFICIILVILLSSCQRDVVVFEPGNLLSEDQTKFALQVTDLNPSNPNQVRLMYSHTYESKVWDGQRYDREHVWPDSKLSTTAQKRDLHNIRACDTTVNQLKADRLFIDAPGIIFYQRVDTLFFYPGLWDQGDVARIILSMVKTSDLDPKDVGLNHKTLIQWHEADPVDDFERNRNIAISSDFLQGNENYFISYPDLANQYFDQSSNIGFVWFIGLLMYIVLMLGAYKYQFEFVKRDDLYMGLSAIFVLFSLICGFIWSWWGMLLILCGFGLLVFYGMKRLGMNQNH